MRCTRCQVIGPGEVYEVSGDLGREGGPEVVVEEDQVHQAVMEHQLQEG